MHNGRAERATGTAANLIPKLRFSLAFLLAFGLGAQRLPDVPNADVDAIVKPITWPPFTPPPAIHMVKPQKAWGACSANKSSKPPPCTYIMYMTETEAACRFRRLAELAIAMKHAALLRGINVGGKNPLPMKDLTRMFEAAGGRNVRTYIQSGNVIFEAAASSSKIGEAVTKSIEKQFGYWIPVVLRTSEQLQKAISGNPFVAAGADQKALHRVFSVRCSKRRVLRKSGRQSVRPGCLRSAWPGDLSASSERHGADKVDQRVLRFPTFHDMYRAELGDGAQAR